MSLPVEHLTSFLRELDALKSVERKNFITANTRVENSAEHSWHLAMACWLFADQLEDDFDLEKLFKLALIHDLGEIDAGDTFLYAAERNDASERERQGIARLAGETGNRLRDFAALWEEQETGNSPEARLLKVLDRLLPFLCNINTGGRAWRENGVAPEQVAAAHAFIADEAPEVHIWISEQLAHAISAGWFEREQSA